MAIFRKSRDAQPQSCIDAIAALVKLGNGIAGDFEKTNDLEKMAVHAPQWTEAVTDFLAENLGKECAARFRNAPAYTYALPNRDFIGNSYWQQIEGKLRTLSHILAQLRQRELNVLS